MPPPLIRRCTLAVLPLSPNRYPLGVFAIFSRVTSQVFIFFLLVLFILARVDLVFSRLLIKTVAGSRSFPSSPHHFPHSIPPRSASSHIIRSIPPLAFLSDLSSLSLHCMHLRPPPSLLFVHRLLFQRRLLTACVASLCSDLLRCLGVVALLLSSSRFSRTGEVCIAVRGKALGIRFRSSTWVVPSCC